MLRNGRAGSTPAWGTTSKLNAMINKLDKGLLLAIMALIENTKNYDSCIRASEIIRDNNHESGRYPYIPTNPRILSKLILSEIVPIKQKDKKSFLDAGAGSCLIPELMSLFGFKESSGLEFSDFYVKLDQSKRLFQGDILTYNFSNWDVIYSYNPMCDHEMMKRGIDNIITTMKKGAILYFFTASISIENFLKEKEAVSLSYIDDSLERIYKFVKK